MLEPPPLPPRKDGKLGRASRKVSRGAGVWQIHAEEWRGAVLRQDSAGKTRGAAVQAAGKASANIIPPLPFDSPSPSLSSSPSPNKSSPMRAPSPLPREFSLRVPSVSLPRMSFSPTLHDSRRRPPLLPPLSLPPLHHNLFVSASYVSSQRQNRARALHELLVEAPRPIVGAPRPLGGHRRATGASKRDQNWSWTVWLNLVLRRSENLVLRRSERASRGPRSERAKNLGPKAQDGSSVCCCLWAREIAELKKITEK